MTAEPYPSAPAPITAFSGATSTMTPPPKDEVVENSSVGELISHVTADLSTLMRKELELAKAEIGAEAKKAGKGAGMLGGGGLAGYFTLLFLSFALVFALGNVMNLGWAALIVAAIWGVATALLFASGRQELKSVNPKPEQTIQTLKEDAQWAKHPIR